MKLLQQFSDDLESLVARASPAVVGVEHSRGHGTGLFLTPDGYVLTNRHVVMRHPRGLTVQLSNGEELRGTLVGADAPTDLAVVRAEGTDFPTLPLAEPQSVRVGQLVMAIGNPFRLEQSVSLGVVSAINRSLTLPDGTILEGMIQTDAAINPGNSGGPLLDSSGQLIGMNTMIYSKSGSSAGIGFAVPADTIARIVPQLIRSGRVEQVGLGIQLDPAQRLERRLGLRGVIVMGVAPGSAAERAGMKGITETDRGLALGDVIVGVDGKPIDSYDALYNTLDTRKPGEKAKVELLRGRQRVTVEVELQLLQP